MRQKLIYLILLILAISCNKTEPINVNRIGFISLSPTGNARNQILKGAQKAAKDFNSYIEEYPPVIIGNQIDQIKSMTNAIEDGCSTVIIAPTSKTVLDEIIDMANLNNINVITVRTGIITENIKATINSDINKISNDLEIYFRDLSNVKNLMVVSINPYNNYYNTFITNMQNYCRKENISFRSYYSTQDDNSTKLYLENYVKYHTNSILITIDESSAAIATQLKKDYPNLSIYSFGSSLTEIGELEHNNYKALIVEDYFSMGYIAVKTALSISNKEKYEKSINTNFTILTKSTMFSKSTQWLLFSTK